MPIEMSITSNTAKVLKQLKRVQRSQIPFATSKAMQFTVLEAREAVYKSIDKTFDRPGSQFRRRGKPGRQGVRSGWIRADWPSRKDIQANRRVNASVYVWGTPLKDTAGKNTNGRNIAEIMARNIYGQTARSVSLHTPQALFGRRMIIEPTGALLGNPNGDKLIRLSKTTGNIIDLRRRLTTAKNDKQNYVVIMIGNRANRNKSLTPGIYKKIYQEYDYRQQPRTSRGRLQRAVRLVKLLNFETQRAYDDKWDFPRIVRRSYERSYERNFRKAYREALRTAR